MALADPAKLQDSISERLTALLVSGGHLNGPTPFERAGLLRDIDKIEKSDAGTAYLLRAIVAQLDGDIEEVERHVASAFHLNAPGVDTVLADAYANLGFASKALRHLRAKMRGGMPDVSMLFQSALNSGSAVTAMQLLDEAASADQGLSQLANEMIPRTRLVAAALKATGHTEDELAAIIDVAGEVMRENKLLWLDKNPTIYADPREEAEESAPGVHYYFRVDVTPDVGAKLTGEVGWRLVERNLTMPALTVAFVGVREEEALTA